MNPTLSYEEFCARLSEPLLTEAGSCPVIPVIRMLQGKWKLQILYELCIQSPLRFGQLRRQLDGVTHSALANALRELEEDGLISRTQYNEIPPHVEYALSAKGRDLLPVFYAIAGWGLKYIP